MYSCSMVFLEAILCPSWKPRRLGCPTWYVIWSRLVPYPLAIISTSQRNAVVQFLSSSWESREKHQDELPGACSVNTPSSQVSWGRLLWRALRSRTKTDRGRFDSKTAAATVASNHEFLLFFCKFISTELGVSHNSKQMNQIFVCKSMVFNGFL